MIGSIPGLFLAATGTPVLGCLTAVLFRGRDSFSRRLASSSVIAGSFWGLILAVHGLFDKEQVRFAFPGPVPEHPFTFLLDPLAGLFLAVIFGLAALCSCYSIGYSQHRNLGGTQSLEGLCFGVLVTSMACVATANDVITFLGAWELMTVSTFLMVPYEHERPDVRKAAYIFLVASQLGTACIVAAFFGLAYHASSIEFDAFRTAPALPSPLCHILFLVALIGFGTKAGLVPLHVWLPLAHPVAPSHVSAMMSGVMIKTALYGLLRFMFEFLRIPSPGWGLFVLALGTASALFGVLFALLEHDLKRLLAYHSVENIGIIVMGIGASLYLSSTGHQVAAGCALAAGLFHLVNHAIFKALLFLGAGSVQHATGVRNLDELGGLLRRMPYTGLLFLIGAMAICALPPLNGFASEWMTYRCLWDVSRTGGSWGSLIGPISAAVLAMVGGLAAACFAKAFGITFLGQPRSVEAWEAKEAPVSMTAPMAILAILCGLFGLVPGLPLTAISRVLPASMAPAIAPLSLPGHALVLPCSANETDGVVPVIVLVAAGLAVAAFKIAWWWLGGAPTPSRVYQPWGCGYPHQPVPPLGDVLAHESLARTEYTATSFSQPFAYLFRQFFARRELLDFFARRTEYLPEKIFVQVRTKNPFDSWVYKPMRRAIVRLSWKVSRIQAGSVQLYLSYMLVTVLLLLLLAP